MIASVTNERLYDYRGLSTDSKPSVAISTGSTFFEIDTLKLYMFNSVDNTWVEIDDGGSGGAGILDVKVNDTSVVTNKVANLTVVDNVTSTTTNEALSANMGKNLQDLISNLLNIGRFLSIWNCVTGLPTTSPTTLPYSYKTGDYFRVGTVGTTNYKPTGSSYTGVASTTVETETVDVGFVYYYDGTTWMLQAGGAGGQVLDVKVNGTSVLDQTTGVANITDATLSDVKYTTQTLTDAQKAQARTNINAAINAVRENYVIATTDWTSISSVDPFKCSCTATAVHTIGSSTICELINNDPVVFANTGILIAAVNGQTVTFYAVKLPTASVTLGVNYYG